MLPLPLELFSAPPSRRRLRPRIAPPMLSDRRSTTSSLTTTLVRRPAARLAVTLVCRLALLARQNQTAGDGEISHARSACGPLSGAHFRNWKEGSFQLFYFIDVGLRLFRSKTSPSASTSR